MFYYWASCVCVCVSVRMCVCVSVRVCGRVRVCTQQLLCLQVKHFVIKKKTKKNNTCKLTSELWVSSPSLFDTHTDADDPADLPPSNIQEIRVLGFSSGVTSGMSGRQQMFRCFGDKARQGWFGRAQKKWWWWMYQQKDAEVGRARQEAWSEEEQRGDLWMWWKRTSS